MTTRTTAHRVVAGIFVVASAIVVAAPTARAVTSTTTVKIMAVGDSFTAGVGGGLADGNVSHGAYGSACRQEFAASYAGQTYNALIAKGHSAELRMSACLGAVTSDILSTQRPGAPGPQIDDIRAYQPDVVVMTIGGNDLDVSGVTEQCVLTGCDAGRLNNPPLAGIGVPGERTSWDGFYDRLVYVYNAIHKADAHAHIYVLTYPIFFAGATQWSIAQKIAGCNYISSSDASLINAAIKRAGDTIYWAVQKANADTGGKVHFVDWRSGPPDPQALCSSSNTSTWTMNGITLGISPYSVHDSFHPTINGYQVAANRLVTALNTYPWPA
jgi:lysophospholipase L1-like esterase